MRALYRNNHSKNMLRNNKLTETRLAQMRKIRYICTWCEKSAYGSKGLSMLCGHCLPDGYLFMKNQMPLFLPWMDRVHNLSRTSGNCKLSEKRLSQMRKARYQCETCKASAYGPRGRLLVCGLCWTDAYLVGGQQMLVSLPWLVEVETRTLVAATELIRGPVAKMIASATF
jgi:hypothetical protein